MLSEFEVHSFSAAFPLFEVIGLLFLMIFGFYGVLIHFGFYGVLNYFAFGS